MFEPLHYKRFAETITVINFAQTMLNKLINKNVSDVIDSLELIIRGAAPSGLIPEIKLLDSLLNHPEQFIKDLDDLTRDKLHSEIKGMLENFIAERKDPQKSMMATKI